MKRTIIITVFFLLVIRAGAAYLLIPMDQTQKNHLKAYGIAYWVINQNAEAYWCLNMPSKLKMSALSGV